MNRRSTCRSVEHYEAERDTKGVLSFTSYSAVMECLHPDQPTPSLEQRQNACGLFR
jgi:hypothetical protein